MDEFKTAATAARLRRRLRRLCLSQTDLARAIGVSQSSVSAWCRGAARPNPELRKALHKILSIPPGVWDSRREKARRALEEKCRTQ